jgi:hypothetical protein
MRQLVESILAMSVELSEDGNTGSHLWVTLRLSACPAQKCIRISQAHYSPFPIAVLLQKEGICG